MARRRTYNTQLVKRDFSYSIQEIAEQFGLHPQAVRRWIKAGLRGAGNILFFNNGDTKERRYSTVDEFVPPINADGTYTLQDGVPFGPESLEWEYDPEPPERFFSFFISFT